MTNKTIWYRIKRLEFHEDNDEWTTGSLELPWDYVKATIIDRQLALVDGRRVMDLLIEYVKVET